MKQKMLWRNLSPREKQGIDDPDDWTAIGFSGCDPSTDLGSVGVFGLENLLAISDPKSEYGKETLKIYNDSVSEQNKYFFAIIGLSITKKLLFELTYERRFDPIILQNIDLLLELNQPIQDTFHKISNPKEDSMKVSLIKE